MTEIAWHLLENKKYGLALDYFQRRLALDPKDLMSTCNSAHCYLFMNDYEKAIRLYKDNLDKRIDDTHTFKQVILDDFVFFKSSGFDTAPMEKVFADLKLEKPKGYTN